MKVTRSLFENIQRQLSTDGVVFWITVVGNPLSTDAYRFHGRLGGVSLITNHSADICMVNFATDVNYCKGSPSFNSSCSRKTLHVRFAECRYIQDDGCGMISLYPAEYVGENIHISIDPKPILFPYQSEPRVVEVAH